MYPYPNYTPYYTNRPEMIQNASRNLMPAMMSVPSIMGEMVTDFETVKTARVDYSGQTAYYPTYDGKMIYSKALMPDGTARIGRYQLMSDEQSDKASDTSLETIINKIDALTETVTGITSLWGGNNDE